MEPRILSGKVLSGEIEQELRRDAAALTAGGTPPCLAVILLGDNPASHTYVRNKIKAAERVGIASRDRFMPATTSQAELEAEISALNADPAVHGILCQMPLPEGLNAERVTRLIDPAKDVDCFHPFNVGLLAMGIPRFYPCTPAGVLELMSRNGIEVSGQHVVILGRSNITGRPLSLLLSHKGTDATVTVCHSRTRELATLTRQADILVAATGIPQWVTGEMVKEGAVVIDVGINRIDDASRKQGYRLVGDVDYATVAPKTTAITPVPGGVGPMTITMLLRNTIQAARMAGDSSAI
ncbi:MAG: bifunctional methylenetetrahydrofolate dehydrogenase/methenyltetrahydrofolate cyclohydrolase FolD [SAR324 cluster bacterium]|nr:bifunctional methylenetetrahydrofolate dehydrogenase/methenyltetrahydrofolate cyclohydrolase FolD [SAR324 cluster bacterium]